MKKLITIFIVFSSLLCANAQSINWNTNVDNKNIIYASTGFEFGLTNKLGFAYSLKTEKPLMLITELSMPMGEDLFDDINFRLGGQMLMMQRKNLLVSTKINAVYKAHETNLVQLSGFGLEAGAVFGYYKSSWHLAGELGYDHVLATRIKNSEIMVANFPEISDGWYRNSAGNFYYGIQGSKTLGSKMEINIRAGQLASKFADTNPVLPFYTQVGLMVKIGGGK